MKNLLAAFAISLLAGCSSVPDAQIAPEIKVTLGNGSHGSGIHIGNGYYLTAAHVTSGHNVVLVKNINDTVETVAEVLWESKEYDVALIKGPVAENLKTAKLDCRAPVYGEAVTTTGNPLDQDFVTTKGFVAANGIKSLGPWKEIFISDIKIAPGNSGGGVLDSNGDIIGLAVGMGLFPLNGQTITPSGLSYIVPSSTVCKLMGKA